MDPEAARLVACGRDDAALMRVAADDDGLAAQEGVVPLFDAVNSGLAVPAGCSLKTLQFAGSLELRSNFHRLPLTSPA